VHAVGKKGNKKGIKLKLFMKVPQGLNAMHNAAMRPLEAHGAHDSRKHFDRLASVFFG
jgi:hypothetical protein